jgi:hypothetical protein
MQNVIDDLGMQAEDEGCCVAQIANFCQRRKVTHDTVDFKHKLFEASKDSTPRDDLPRLVFVCASNNLYPITDEEHRETIVKSCSKVGGSINEI